MHSTIQVYDFFSGCGGTSCGLKSAGMEIAFALDNDPIAIKTFQKNFKESKAIVQDIREMKAELLAPYITNSKRAKLFCGCAPCQPFSKHNKNHSDDSDPRRNLLFEFSRFVSYWEPEYVLVENVPGIQKIKSKGPFDAFLSLLSSKGYFYDYAVLPACNFGVPQKRERLVLIASKIAPIKLPKPSHGPTTNKSYSTVEEWIIGLPSLKAGETCLSDPDHQAASLSKINLERIKGTPEGGNRTAWPKHLWLNCHKDHIGHTDVYGRLHRKKLASGLTTRCISLSNGRFGHPTENRAISIREAACLQTFPRSYSFSGNMAQRARQIGNAVPPLMAKKIAEQIVSQYFEINCT